MNEIPKGSESYRKLNPHLFSLGDFVAQGTFSPKPRIRQSQKPLLNRTEQQYYDLLVERGHSVRKQALTLRLDPPFKSYTPDLFYLGTFGIVLVEVKGPHRFREKGIAKAALAAKTYPEFRFELADWTGTKWKITVLSS